MKQDDILSKHQFAKSLYSEAEALACEIEDLFKNDYDIPGDSGERSTPGGPRISRPARARAILEKFLTLLSVRATVKVNVVPRDTGEQEQRACTKIERWIDGYQRTYQAEVKRPIFRHFLYWYLLRGRGCIEVRFDPSTIGTKRMPIRTIVEDPLCIYPVWGTSGIGWYTKEYSRYVWDLKEELERKRKGRGKGKWKAPEWPEHDDEEMEVIEYWDDEYRGVLIGGEEVYWGKHDYGFVPLVEVHCMDTPMNDMEWAYNSVIGPIADSLKQQYVLASKMAQGVDLFYWPKILVQDEAGRVSLLDSGSPGVESYISPTAKVTVINPTPNAQVLQQLMSWLSADVQLGSIPEIAWGAEPSSLQSGFAVSQVLAQVMDKIYDKKNNLEMGLSWYWGQVLRLVEKFGRASGFDSEVVADMEGYHNGKKQKALIRLGPDDVDGHYLVDVNITPELPQDRMVKAQLAQAFRAPGVDGKPLLDDRTILEDIIEVEHPDQVAQRIRAQLLSAESQQVRDISLAAAEQEWMDTNKDVVKLAEKKEELVPASKVREMAEMLAQELHAQMMGQGGQLEAMAQAAGQGQPMPIQPGQPMGPGQMGPGGPSPEAMPSQMAMLPEDALPDVPQLQQSQARRALAPRSE